MKGMRRLPNTYSFPDPLPGGPDCSTVSVYYFLFPNKDCLTIYKIYSAIILHNSMVEMTVTSDN